MLLEVCSTRVLLLLFLVSPRLSCVIRLSSLSQYKRVPMTNSSPIQEEEPQKSLALFLQRRVTSRAIIDT